MKSWAYDIAKSGPNPVLFFSGFALDPVLAGRKLHADFGSTVAVNLPLTKRRAPRKFVITKERPLAQQVLRDTGSFNTVGVALTRGPKHTAQRRLRNGVVRMNGPQQKELRRAYSPPLTKACIHGVEQKIADVCAAEVETWPRDTTFIVDDLADRLARRNAVEILFRGRDPERAMHIANRIAHHSRLQYSLRNFLFPFDFPGMPYHALLRFAEETESDLIRWIEDCGPSDPSLVGCIAGLPSVGCEVTDARQRAAQLWTLFGASFETIGTTLRWAICHLAWNKDVQGLLREEANEKESASAYLKSFVLECLRLTPPVAYQFRRPTSDIEFNFTPVSRRDHILINAAEINRDPDTFSRPDEINLERWLTKAPSPMEPLAFSAGPRRCLGFNFAMSVLEHAIAEICRTGTIDISDTQKIGTRLAITQGPVGVRLSLRASRRAPRSCRFRGGARWQMSA